MKESKEGLNEFVTPNYDAFGDYNEEALARPSLTRFLTLNSGRSTLINNYNNLGSHAEAYTVY